VTVLAAQLATFPPAPGTYVFHGRRLRPGVVLKQTARFDDDVWHLGPIMGQQHQGGRSLNFGSLPEAYRPVAKELFYSLLSGDLPADEDRPSVSTMASAMVELRRFLTWLSTRAAALRRPPEPLSSLQAADLEDYYRHVHACLANPDSRRFALAAVRYFWRYRHQLSCDRLPFDPHKVIDGWSQSHRRPRENTTDRIPEQVLGPLLAWSLRFIDEFAVDILAAHRLWLDRRDGQRTGPILTKPQMRIALRTLLDDHLARQQPLPGFRGQPNMKELSFVLGCNRRHLYDHHDEIRAVADQVGVTRAANVDIPITARLDGKPWIERLSNDINAPDGLSTLTRLLRASCYVVIAFLSGMRDSEVKHLRSGCQRVHHDPDGRPYRWTLTSLAFKGETDPSGVEATWVVGEPVARAVDVLQRLRTPESTMLFATTPNSQGYRRAETNCNDVPRSTSTNRQLNELRDWINHYCTEHNRPDAVPEVNGQPWRLTTRQFRRTLAWFIARQPGGAIAGAIQYRHLSIQSPMLRNRYYIGYIEYDDEEIKGRHEPLVDDDLFERVQDELDSRGVAGDRRRIHHS
jgi:hypothetical protein